MPQSSTLLVIDAGNTNIVLGVYRGDVLINPGVWQRWLGHRTPD